MTHILTILFSSLAILVQTPNEAKCRLRGHESFALRLPAGFHQVAETKAMCSLRNEKGTTQITLAAGPKVKNANPKAFLEEFASVFEKSLLSGTDKKFAFASSGDFEIVAQDGGGKKYRVTYSRYTWNVAQVEKDVILAMITGDKYFYTYSFFHIDPSDKELGIQTLKSLKISPDSLF